MARTKANKLAEWLFHKYARDWAGDEWDEDQDGTWEELPSKERGAWEEDAKQIMALIKGEE